MQVEMLWPMHMLLLWYDLHGTVQLQMRGLDMLYYTHPGSKTICGKKKYRLTAYMYIKYYMGLIVPMIRVVVIPIMIPRMILWHKEASEKVCSSKFGFYIVKNIWFDTKIIQTGQVCDFIDFCIFDGGHLRKWPSPKIFRWLTGFIKKAIPKEYLCQFWCLFTEMKDSPEILQLSGPLLFFIPFSVGYYILFLCD